MRTSRLTNQCAHARSVCQAWGQAKVYASIQDARPMQYHAVAVLSMGAVQTQIGAKHPIVPRRSAYTGSVFTHGKRLCPEPDCRSKGAPQNGCQRLLEEARPKLQPAPGAAVPGRRLHQQSGNQSPVQDACHHSVSCIKHSVFYIIHTPGPPDQTRTQTIQFWFGPLYN